MESHSFKEDLQNMLQEMPDDCTPEDLHYRIHLINKIRRGEERIEQEGGVSQEEAEKRLSKWIIK